MTYSLKKLLIILGLVIIPFYEILLRILPFVACHAPDSRVTKELLALVFSLSIGLLAVFQGNIKPFRNKYLLIIPIFILISLIMAPYSPLFINNNEVGDFYFWKPFSEVLCFGLMIIAIASMEERIDDILNVMVTCGSIMAGYVILQKFGIDQFWLPKEGGDFTSVRSQLLGGNLGQPTIVASWIVMMVPLAFHLKRRWSFGIMLISCIFIQSAMAIIALIIIGLITLIRNFPYKIVSIALIFIILLSCIIFIPNIKSKIIERMDGRSEVWKQTILDIRDGQIKELKGKFPFTGIGFGRFSFSFQMKHSSSHQFMQTHNDLLEFIYDCGLIGGILLICGIYFMFKIVLTNISPLSFSVFLSFLAIFICSLGGFPFQLGAHQFYASVLAGILNNEVITRRIR